MGDAANKRVTVQLALVVVAMFGFGFAMVPLYDVLCDLTGLNGKTGVASAEGLDGVVDEERWVTVEFTANVNSQLPWKFHPNQKRIRVHPGKVYAASYYAENLSELAVVGQAVPSVTPSRSARYFSKTECFCFNQQRLEAGKGEEMPLRFIVDKALPKEITTITLAYTFFKSEGEG